MPLGQGIVEVLRAIPPRIEVAVHGSTLKITAGSFDAALDHAREAYGGPAALAVEVRNRFWPRVSVTFTTDAGQAALAPPVEELRQQAQEAAAAGSRRTPTHRAGPEPVEPAEPAVVEEAGFSVLEEIFARQERQRQERARIPVQRAESD